jgi:hypothetical protein
MGLWDSLAYRNEGRTQSARLQCAEIASGSAGGQLKAAESDAQKSATCAVVPSEAHKTALKSCYGVRVQQIAWSHAWSRKEKDLQGCRLVPDARGTETYETIQGCQ